MDFIKIKDFVKTNNFPAYRLNQIRQGVLLTAKVRGKK